VVPSRETGIWRVNENDQTTNKGLPLDEKLFDTSRMDLHLKPDINPRKGVQRHMASIILPNGLNLTAIKIYKDKNERVNIGIQNPCPLTNSVGEELSPASLTELQGSLLKQFVRQALTLRHSEIRDFGNLI
jgi:hypothetical protein